MPDIHFCDGQAVLCLVPTQNCPRLGYRCKVATSWQPGWLLSPPVWGFPDGKVHILHLWDNISGRCLWALTHAYSARFFARILRGTGQARVGGQMCLRALWHAGNLVQTVSQQLAGVSVWENVRGRQIFLGVYLNGTEGFPSLRRLSKTSWASWEYPCSEMLDSERNCRLEAHLKLVLFWPLLEAGELVVFINQERFCCRDCF